MGFEEMGAPHLVTMSVAGEIVAGEIVAGILTILIIQRL
jgi:hypothetical protein